MEEGRLVPVGKDDAGPLLPLPLLGDRNLGTDVDFTQNRLVGELDLSPARGHCLGDLGHLRRAKARARE